MLRALTIYQPWADLIVAGHKDIENRTWRPSRRQLQPGDKLVIHAGKRYDEKAAGSVRYGKMEGRIPASAHVPSAPDLHRRGRLGAILGIATYRGCVDASGSPWFAGPQGWLLEQPIAFLRPIDARGMQGLWKLSPGQERIVRLAWEQAERPSA